MEGAILSCHIIILPSDVMSALKSAGAIVVTCVCLQCTWRVLFCSHMRLSCGMSLICFKSGSV